MGKEWAERAVEYLTAPHVQSWVKGGNGQNGSTVRRVVIIFTRANAFWSISSYRVGRTRWTLWSVFLTVKHRNTSPAFHIAFCLNVSLIAKAMLLTFSNDPKWAKSSSEITPTNTAVPEMADASQRKNGMWRIEVKSQSGWNKPLTGLPRKQSTCQCRRPGFDP